MSHPKPFTRAARKRGLTSGFTLVEIAVVLFIVGLLIAGVLGPLETQLEARDRNATIESMNEIIEALYGYAITNRRLPCPNTDGDGLEELDINGNGTDDYQPAEGFSAAQLAVGGECLNTEGFVPWVTLGTPQGDEWSHRFRYRVTTPDFTTTDTDGLCNGNGQHFDLCAVGDIAINSIGDEPSTAGVVEGKALIRMAQNVGAVIVSHGRNGFGATPVAGAARPAPPGGTDEAENADNDVTFISRSYSGDNDACADDQDESTPMCAFDDIVMWLSPAILNNRMVSAGRLP